MITPTRAAILFFTALFCMMLVAGDPSSRTAVAPPDNVVAQP